MIERRAFLTGAAAFGSGGSLAGAATASEDAALVMEPDYSGLLVEIRNHVQRYGERATSVRTGVESVREQQRIFLRSALKYPEFIDVGIAVWEDAYDWHVHWRQPLTITRQGDTYHMVFMLSTLVLRANQTLTYVGPGYDK